MDIFKEDASTRIVVSHPKSGRTWLHFALNEYGIKAHFTHARSSVGVKSRGYMGREIPEALKEHLNSP